MTKTIELSKGYVATVDDDMYDYLSQWSWYAGMCGGKVYASSRPKGKKLTRRPTILMHRIVMNALDGWQVDHIDGNSLNNTRANLRLCSHIDNCANRGPDADNKTGYKGVHKIGKRYKAQIGHLKHIYNLGRYDTPEEAAAAYNEKAKELFGPFAWLNPLSPDRG